MTKYKFIIQASLVFLAIVFAVVFNSMTEGADAFDKIMSFAPSLGVFILAYLCGKKEVLDAFMEDE